MDRTSPTGWFEYTVRNVPDEVLFHLEQRDDVVALEDTEDRVTFLSENGILGEDLYDEDGDDGFEDYGILSSSPIREPSSLPASLRGAGMTIEDYVDSDLLAGYIEALGLGQDDPREYTLQGDFSFRLDAFRDGRRADEVLEPVPIDTVTQADADGLVRDNTGTDYPTVAEMTTWADAFEEEEFDDVELYAIGGTFGEQFVFDGVVVRVNVTDAVRQCVDDKFNGSSAAFSRADEVQFYDGEWVRLWWD